MSLLAFTHAPSPKLSECELTFKSRDPINYELALQQHATYCRALENAGLEVRELCLNPHSPDGCFVEDVAVVLDEIAILCPMGVPSRRAERDAWRIQLAKERQVIELPEDSRLEGGDILQVGDELIAGHSPRTNAKGLESLNTEVARYGYRLRVVPVQGCLHLKTACTALDEESLLVNPQWIDTAALSGFELLEAADTWGSNVLRLPEVVLMSSTQSATIAQVEQCGFSVAAVDISEFEKAEAGLTCLSLVLNTP